MITFLTMWLPLLIIVFCCIVFMSIMISSTAFKSQKFDEERMKDENLQTDYARLIHIYEFLSRFPLTSKATNHLHDVISGLSIYNDVQQRVETARIAAISYMLCIGAMSVVLVITRYNPIFSVAVFVIIMAYRRDFVNKRLQKKRGSSG